MNLKLACQIARSRDAKVQQGGIKASHIHLPRLLGMGCGKYLDGRGEGKIRQLFQGLLTADQYHYPLSCQAGPGKIDIIRLCFDLEIKRRALAQLALHPDPASHKLHQPAADGQAEPSSAILSGC